LIQRPGKSYRFAGRAGGRELQPIVKTAHSPQWTNPDGIVTMDQIYDDAGYGDYIYSGNPQPCLDSDDAIFAQQQIGVREVQQ
jgi:hypothetical protein